VQGHLPVAGIRSFVALELNPRARRHAIAWQQVLREECRSCGWRVRWIEPRDLHVTLKFLGTVAEDYLDALGDGLVALAPDLAVPVRLGGPGAFPERGPARVLWLGVDGRGPELGALVERIEGLAGTLGFAAESRAFRGHLTLGRVRHARGSFTSLEQAVMLRHAALHTDSPTGLETVLNRLTLFESHPGPGGPVYRARVSVQLGQTV